MAGISSLLSSARATRAKIQSANDAQIAFEWQNSAQTHEDYKAYKSYLDDALKTATDPSQQLSYQTKLRGAFSSYASNEIQRQGQAIMEGKASLEDKMGSVESLYKQALANGDENLAQNLVTTWNSLSIQAQNQAASKASAGRASASKSATALKNQVYDIVDQHKAALNAFVQADTQATTPQEKAANLAKINAQLPTDMQVPEGTGIFDVAASYAQAIASVYKQAVEVAPTNSSARVLQNAYNTFLDGPVLKLPGENGSTVSLTLNDIQKQIAASNIGQTMFSVVPGANGNAFVKNKVDNFQFGHDAEGNVVALQTYSLGGMDLSAKVSNAKGEELGTYKDLLQNSGFNVTGGENGSFIIEDASGQNRLNGQAFAQVYMTPDGRLQLVNNENQIFDLSFDNNGTFNGVNRQTANPFLQQYSADYKGTDTPYFQAHPEQAQAAFGTAGELTPQTIEQFNKDVGIGKNPTIASPQIFSSALPKGSPTNVLQGAANIQHAQAQLQAKQIITAPIKQIQAPNIAKSILNSRSNATIKVSKPTAPKENISTKPVKDKGKFTGVSTKVPKFNISF